MIRGFNSLPPLFSILFHWTNQQKDRSIEPNKTKMPFEVARINSQQRRNLIRLCRIANYIYLLL